MTFASWIDSAPWPVFAVSATLLCSGLFGMVWWDAVRLTFLDAVTLDVVERRHPHFPSVKTILGLVLCAGMLLLVASVALRHHRYLGWELARLNLVAVFVLLASAGILLEMKRGVGGYAFAVAAGSALAFAGMLLIPSGTGPDRGVTLALLIVLLVCVSVARLLLFRGWSRRVRVAILLTLLAWLAVGVAG